MIAMGIDATQWRIEIARYVKFAGRVFVCVHALSQTNYGCLSLCIQTREKMHSRLYTVIQRQQQDRQRGTLLAFYISKKLIQIPANPFAGDACSG